MYYIQIRQGGKWLRWAVYHTYTEASQFIESERRLYASDMFRLVTAEYLRRENNEISNSIVASYGEKMG